MLRWLSACIAPSLPPGRGVVLGKTHAYNIGHRCRARWCSVDATRIPLSGCSMVRQQLSAETQSTHTESGVPVRRPHILVVDDDPTNRRVLQGMLAQLGYACSAVDDGAKA